MEILISHEEGINSQLPVKIQTNKTQKQKWPARSAFPLNLRWQEPSVEQHAKFTVWLYFYKKLFKHKAIPFYQDAQVQDLSFAFGSHTSVHCAYSCYTFYTRESKTIAVRSLSPVPSSLGSWLITTAAQAFEWFQSLVNMTGQDRLRLLQIRLLRSLISSLNSARKG